MNLPSFKARGATYFNLKIACPVCHDNGRNVPSSFWVHGADGGEIYVGDDAHYQCKLCEYHEHVKNWRYGCPEHSGAELECLEASSQGVAQAVSTAGQLVSATGQKWLIRFLENMGEF